MNNTFYNSTATNEPSAVQYSKMCSYLWYLLHEY